MGRGLGTTQRRILDALAQWNGGISVPELAVLLERSQPQIRTAVRALESRDLVRITKGYIGWKGKGEYGPETWEWEYTGEVDEDGWPLHTDQRIHSRAGMPVFGLKVWLPEMYEEAVEAALESFRNAHPRYRRRYTHQQFERAVHEYSHRTPEQQEAFDERVNRLLELAEAENRSKWGQ